MVALLTPNAKQQFFDNAGQPAAGFKLHTYAAGTTTPQATYTDRAGLVANANPVILDARGEATLYLTAGIVYDYVLRDSNDALVWTRSGVSAETEDLVLRGDLEASDGGSRVGVLQTGDGAQAEEILTAYRRVVSPEQFGCLGDGITDDAAGMQLALDRAEGGVLRLTPGRTYGIGAALKIPSNTTIDARGATIKRVGSTNNIIRPKINGVTGGYGASLDWTIIGGIWDGNKDAFPDACTVIAMAHSQRVRIHGVVIKNVPTFHHIEVNSSQYVTIERCTFIGGSEQSSINVEAVQIDRSYEAGYPWEGPWDGTHCNFIHIVDCVFDSNGTGVGTHSGDPSFVHDTINITGCEFRNCYYAGIRAENWTGLRASNNRFTGGAYGIRSEAFGQLLSGPTIEGNAFFNMGNNGAATSDARAIRILGDSGGAEIHRRVIISNNTVANLTADGSGEPSTATHAISIDYGQQVVVADNVCHTINGAGIYVFGGSAITVSGNVVTAANLTGNGTWAGIVVGNVATTGATVTGNNTNTMRINTVSLSSVMNNVITTASGLADAGNTNTYIRNNLESSVMKWADFAASQTVDPPSLGAGIGVTQSITCNGVNLGDVVVGVSFTQIAAGVMMDAVVTAANTVSVRFRNDTGATVDMASGTLRVFVNKAY